MRPKRGTGEGLVTHRLINMPSEIIQLHKWYWFQKSIVPFFFVLLHCIILSLKYLCSNLSQIPKESLFVSFTTAQWLILPVFNFCFSFLQMSSVGNYSAFGNQICFVALKSFLGVLDVQILFRRPLCVSLEMVQNAGSAQVKSLRRERCC